MKPPKPETAWAKLGEAAREAAKDRAITRVFMAGSGVRALGVRDGGR